MLYNVCYLFILFLIYSVLGWLVEVTLSLIEHKKFINRGFLIGPYCPIYGVGVLLITLSLKNYTKNALVLFILSMVICMVLEYFTSFIMELLFNARWWDYTNRKFNINGRICLETTIPFGLAGLLIMYIINPFFTSMLNKLPENTLMIISIFLAILFVVDLVISFLIILKIKNPKLQQVKDNTESINKQVKEYLLAHSIWTKRLVNSFPNLKIDKYKK